MVVSTTTRLLVFSLSNTAASWKLSGRGRLSRAFGGRIWLRFALDTSMKRWSTVATSQVVILGSGLDTRAYRLLPLREYHALELEQNSQAFDHKAEVLQDAPLMSRKLDYIVANLADDDWDHKLLAHGFDPRLLTFWVMEGLLPHMDRSSITAMLDTVDALSAPGSEFWADIAGHAAFAVEGFGDVTMKYGEEDPLRGVLCEIPWCLKLQASLGEEGVHFGRKWTPLSSSGIGDSVPVWFVVGKKPIPTEAREKDVCPGLDC